MVVQFTTRGGHVYCIDHANKVFVQQNPQERMGPLWNTPSIVVGRRVDILTAPETDTHVAKLIQTGIVVSREVYFEQSL